MAIVINANDGTISGISVGGLPDGTVDAGTLATDSVDSAELIDGSIDTAHIAADQITGAILPAGSVLQVVNAVTIVRDTTNSTSFTATTITADITPSSTSSKIFVIISASGNTNNTSGHILGYTIYRDSTDLGNSTYGMGQLRGVNSAVRGGISPSFLDSPNTTSSVTYTLYFLSTNASSTVEIPGSAGENRSITLMEIAG